MGADNRLGRRQPHVEEDESFLRRFVIPEKDREALNLFRDLRDDLIERIFHASNSASARPVSLTTKSMKGNLASDTRRKHLALLERAVIVDFVLHLPVGVIEPAAEL